MTKQRNNANTAVALLLNLLWVYLAYAVCRIAFVADNWDLFAGTLTWQSLPRLAWGSFVFDSSAILLTNALYIALITIPLHYKERPWMHLTARIYYLVVNSAAIIANLADSVYYPFALHRTTALEFREFQGNDNLGTIFVSELLTHWYLVLLALLLIAALCLLYRKSQARLTSLPRYYITHTILTALAAVTIIGGTRGGLTTAIRPITVSNAHQYVDEPIQTGIVLNTPFSLLRTLSLRGIDIPDYFSAEELDAIYSPLHGEQSALQRPSDEAQRAIKPRNIVILIMESFAQEFVGALNTTLDDGTYRGYTEFLDSLINHSLYFEQSFATGAISIDAMPSILAAIPRMGNSFVLSPYSLDDINSIASELKKDGYSTAFFHGAENNSMGFQAFACAAGFEKYHGRTEYNADKRFNGDRDFDGTWAIWDEPFLQYYALKMSEMQEPFVTSCFTASSHHPFAIPDEYKDVYLDEGLHKLHKCVRYSDNALRKFFATASQQPWYNNTLFVIVADHASSKVTHDMYKVTLGHFRVPIIFYDPAGQFPTGKREGIAQQTDIMPTILNYLGQSHR